jgi:two-component system response regulator HupR/HoxA
VRTAPLPWPELLELHVVRRLGQLVRRRFGLEPGFASSDGALVAGPEGSAHCAALAARATAEGHAARYACHDGRVELAAPILVAEAARGCVFGSAPDGADVGWLEELIALVADEIAAYQTERAHRDGGDGDGPRPSRYTYEGIIGRSLPVLELYRLLDKVVESDSTVLISGENGTGKELVARAIHANSARARERFVVQNCSAFNDNLLDSELFGHKKGSFTGAIADKQGLFEVADRGTFFLDEIGDMSAALQVKLLRVLQEGTFTPVGDTGTRRVDVRILAATNRDLARVVQQGDFREDLFYRVNVINITCPPLRDRAADIPLLVDHFLRRHARRSVGGARARRRLELKRLAPACMARLAAYPWPGNIRELENEIERLVVLAGDDRVIGEELLSPRLRERPLGAPRSDGGSSLNDTVDAVEREAIFEVLKRHAWNKTRAALELGISRRNLLRKVGKHHLEQRRPR